LHCSSLGDLDGTQPPKHVLDSECFFVSFVLFVDDGFFMRNIELI